MNRLASPRALHMGVMLALALAAAIAGWLLLPGEDERIAALERDGQWVRALGLLEARFAAGDRRQRTLYLMQRIYEHQGDRGRARAVLELLAAERPRDATVQRLLAQLYKQTQDEPAYVRALEKQLELRYAEPACRELIGIHRRNGDYGREQLAIAACRTKGYRRAEDLIRLAFLSASDGNLAEATTILGAVDDRRWLGTSRERTLLFSGLVELKRPADAVRRAARWLRGQPDDDFALELIATLIEAEQLEPAMQLTRQIGTAGDAIALAAGEILIEQVQLEAARSFLAGWLAKARPMTTETATRFVAAALDAEDPLLALKGAETFGLDRFDQAELGELALTLAAGARATEFDRVRPALLAATVAGDSMLAAALSVRDGRADTARLQLAAVRAEDLDERRRPLFEQLSERAGRAQPVTAVLRDLRVPARPAVIGPAQARAKTLLRRAATAKRLRQRRRAAPAGPAVTVVKPIAAPKSERPSAATP